uniref:Myosin tail domain-containing protein n=1 Tax=Oryzias latipes TaxID=8090 RepID=A0A3P9JM99_ORYLA
EITDLTDQLSDGGKSVHELQKARKKIEMEKEELQASLEELEAALEAEETKVLRLQLESSQTKGELERRLQEKEEEIETAKSHQRVLESLQATLDVEVKGRAEGLKLKKKLEADLVELELQVDLLTKSNAELSKIQKKLQQQMKQELQAQLEEEVHSHEVSREEQAALERRCAVLLGDGEGSRTALENSERARKALEVELQEAGEKSSDLNNQLQLALSGRRKLEVDLQTLQQEHEELQAELRGSVEKAKKAGLARVGEELRLEQEHALLLERAKKGLEGQIKDMSGRLEEAEQIALKGGKKIIQKLEAKVKDLEQELDSEQKRHAETVKTLRKNERRLKELLFQSEEDQKNQQRMQELVERLQNKMKAYKRQVEEAEEQANVNLAKYRKTVHELDDAEERADIAESALTKIRSKNRSSFGKGHSSGYSTPYPGLARSPSSVGSEGRGEKMLNDEGESVSSLIPAYLNSLKKL